MRGGFGGDLLLLDLQQRICMGHESWALDLCIAAIAVASLTGHVGNKKIVDIFFAPALHFIDFSYDLVQNFTDFQ